MKEKVMFRARAAMLIAAEPFRKHGMSIGVDYLIEFILKVVEWAYDTGAGKDIPPPFTDEQEIKRQIRW